MTENSSDSNKHEPVELEATLRKESDETAAVSQKEPTRPSLATRSTLKTALATRWTLRKGVQGFPYATAVTGAVLAYFMAAPFAETVEKVVRFAETLTEEIIGENPADQVQESVEAVEVQLEPLDLERQLGELNPEYDLVGESAEAVRIGRTLVEDYNSLESRFERIGDQVTGFMLTGTTTLLDTVGSFIRNAAEKVELDEALDVAVDGFDWLASRNLEGYLRDSDNPILNHLYTQLQEIKADQDCDLYPAMQVLSRRLGQQMHQDYENMDFSLAARALGLFEDVNLSHEIEGDILELFSGHTNVIEGILVRYNNATTDEDRAEIAVELEREMSGIAQEIRDEEFQQSIRALFDETIIPAYQEQGENVAALDRLATATSEVSDRVGTLRVLRDFYWQASEIRAFLKGDEDEVANAYRAKSEELGLAAHEFQGRIIELTEQIYADRVEQLHDLEPQVESQQQAALGDSAYMEANPDYDPDDNLPEKAADIFLLLAMGLGLSVGYIGGKPLHIPVKAGGKMIGYAPSKAIDRFAARVEAQDKTYHQHLQDQAEAAKLTSVPK
tara:strand:+ start:159 stop:1838 length:1680 start_codon:yes stop_codon:yes gene_type:complete